MARRQPVAPRRLGVAGGATAQCAALVHEVGTGGPVDGAVHATSSEQRGVGGVDDGVDVHRRDVTSKNLDFHGILTFRWRKSGQMLAILRITSCARGQNEG